MNPARSHVYAHDLFFFQAEDGIRDYKVTGVQTCALPISWVLYPDPVDFRNYEIPDIYSDTNAFVHQVAEWMTADVPAEQEVTAQPRISIRQESQFEAVLGSRARSGEQFAVWEATYGPVASDGYPAELRDLSKGAIG